MDRVDHNWEELRQLLLEKSYEKKKVTLASGRESDFYIDCRQATLHGRGAVLTGRLIYARLRDTEIEAVGGPTLGADPMVTAASLIASFEGADLPAFIVRKEPKGHGLARMIEGFGNLREGMKAAIIEDVVTTGGSTLKAIEATRAAGLEVVKVICLIDREEGGRENLKENGFELEAIYTKTSLLEGEG